jgi:hypothetical protein
MGFARLSWTQVRAPARTWGTPTELQQPQRQLPFVASLTCRSKSSARDDKFVATLISNHSVDLSSRPKRSEVERSAVSGTLMSACSTS